MGKMVAGQKGVQLKYFSFSTLNISLRGHETPHIPFSGGKPNQQKHDYPYCDHPTCRVIIRIVIFQMV